MKKEVKIFIILACIFVSNVILAEFIGVKIFNLDTSLGFSKFEYELFGMKMGLSYTAGVIIWPLVFVLTDIINEYYGKKGVQFLTYLAVAISIYAFIIVNIAMGLSPAEWWQSVHSDKGLTDFNQAFCLIFGQGNNIIVASLTAFVIGQLIDIAVFQRLKRTKSGSKLWVRATVSTLISQLIDSFVVIFVAFYFLQDWSLNQALSVSINNYIYKGIVALLMIPVLQLIHKWLENYFGKNNAEIMKENAMKNTIDF
jgi:queuosine precursor transporter